MFLVTPPKDADQLRLGPSAGTSTSSASALFPARLAVKTETRTREFPKAFDQVARLVTQALAEIQQPQPEITAQALLEQLLVLHWLDEKGWLGNGRNVWREQFLMHWEADPESSSFYTSYVMPRARVLSAAGLLSQFANHDLALPQVKVLPNALCKTIFDALFIPFRYSLAELSDKEAETQLDPSILSTLFTRQPSEGTATPLRRPSSAFVAPRRVARWMCRETLIQYLGARLSESTQLADRELRYRLEAFFDFPVAQLMTETQVADLQNLFLRSETQRMSRALLGCRVCDPSSGSGELLAAMLEEIAAALAKLDVQLYGDAIIQQHNYEFRLKRKIVNECLFGVSSHEAGVRLIRQRLWLSLVAVEQSRPDVSLAVTMREATIASGLTQHLICGDSLLGCRAFDEITANEEAETFKWRKAFPEIFNLRGGFDIILGSPPYRLTDEKKHWVQLCALFPQLKRAKNLAAAFFDLPRLIGAPNALSCQVIPRALTLAEGWAATRASLRLNYDLILANNAGETLGDARYDQEIMLYRRESSYNDSHVEPASAVMPQLSLVTSAQLDTNESTDESLPATQDEAAARSAVLYQHVSPIGREILERLANLRTLGEIAALKSGQRWQRRKAKANESAAITVPVIKGTNLRQFRITDELPRQEPPAYIQRVLEELRQPKLVVTQTLPHIKKPYDTLILMSALDRQGCVALDTVNQIFPSPDCPYSLELLGALLNSSFARWFFTCAVFSQPTQAVDCSPAELGRLPVPTRLPATLVTQAERLTRKLCKAELPRKYLLRGQIAEYDTLDEIICELYGLSDDERGEIFRLAP